MKMITSAQCLLATRACLLHNEDNQKTNEGGRSTFSRYVEAMKTTRRIGDGIYVIADEYADFIQYLAAKQLYEDANKELNASSKQVSCNEDELGLTM